MIVDFFSNFFEKKKELKGKKVCRSENPPYKDFGQRLFTCRVQLGWSQEDLARFLIESWNGEKKITEEDIAIFESGEVLPEYERVCEIANLLCLSPDYLLYGKQE